ncbi:MAG TPA: VOC family protein [Gaiellaceae bacterium]|nr:VOC family protein [Gaiellaceae bacterium]
MRIRRVVPDVRTERMRESISFYEDVIGLEVGMDLGWIVTLGSTTSESAQLSLMESDATAAVVPNVTIEVEDVDAVHAAAIEHGATVVHPLTDEQWGVRRFFVEDPNGVVVNVMQHVKPTPTRA